MIRTCLLRAKDKDLHDMLGMSHPLHRRRVCLGIQKIKDKEEEEVCASGCVLVSSSRATQHEYVFRSERVCLSGVGCVDFSKGRRGRDKSHKSINSKTKAPGAARLASRRH